jgi:sulfur-oxidizing protein SoxY
MTPDPKLPPTRRWFLADTAAVAGLGLAGPELLSLVIRAAAATPESMRAAIRNVIGEATVRKGRVKLDLPVLVESGNVVSMAVSVESPMTPSDYVKAIHIFTSATQPNVVGVKLGPRAMPRFCDPHSAR